MLSLNSFYKVFLINLLCIYIDLPYDHVWNTVLMCALVPQVATWNSLTSYKNEYAGLVVLHLLLLLNSWLIIEIWQAYMFSVGITLVDYLQNCLNLFNFFFLEGGLLVILIDSMIFLSPFLDVTRTFMSIVSFLAQLDSRIFFLLNAFL